MVAFRVAYYLASNPMEVAAGTVVFAILGSSEDRTVELIERPAVEGAVQKGIEGIANVFVTAVDAVHEDESGWSVRVDVVGLRLLTPEEIRLVESSAQATAGASVEISARTHTELIVTGTGFEPIGMVHKETAPAAPAVGPAPPAAGATPELGS